MKRILDDKLHKYYLYIKDPFIPRYLDTGRQTAAAQLSADKEVLKKFIEKVEERNAVRPYPHTGIVLEESVWMSLKKKYLGEK